jgi:hypothetical protein
LDWAKERSDLLLIIHFLLLTFAIDEKVTKNLGKTIAFPHLSIPRTANEVVPLLRETQAPSLHF